MTSVEYVEKSRLDEAEARLKIAREVLREAEDFISNEHENLTNGDLDSDDARSVVGKIRAALESNGSSKTLVEIVARAIFDFGEADSGSDNGPWEDIPEPAKDFCRRMVSTALTAIKEAGMVIVPREPTREMWAASGDAVVKLGPTHHDRISEAVYRAMITAGEE